MSAVAAAVMLVTYGLAAHADAAGGRPASTAVRHAPASGAIRNYQITGVEDAIGCLTPHRCVAVGYGGGSTPGQVVTVVGGKQAGVSVVHSASNLVAVSCLADVGCWAIGSPRSGGRDWVMVRISPDGKVTGVLRARVASGVDMDAISCSSMASCEIFGTAPSVEYFTTWYLTSWTGRKLGPSHALGSYATDGPEDVSCWHATCVAVGESSGPEQFSQGGIVVITRRGKLRDVDQLNNEGFADVSCVSSETCYAVGFVYTTMYQPVLVTLDRGAVTDVHDLTGVLSGIECAGSTCWAAGMSAPPYVPAAIGVFQQISSGTADGSSFSDSAIVRGPTVTGMTPFIARRGAGFAAVGWPATGTQPLTEVTTN
jgi:hypothetical protein